MSFITTKDGVKLHVEEVGEGTPILFIHEFGGNHQSWEPQLRYFSRRHRCITYAARGYPPSDVPDGADSYSQAIAADDAVAVLDALKIDKAHIVGLSMGGFCTVHFGLRTPQRALSLTVAGAGYGCEKEYEEYEQAVFKVCYTLIDFLTAAHRDGYVLGRQYSRSDRPGAMDQRESGCSDGERSRRRSSCCWNIVDYC